MTTLPPVIGYIRVGASSRGQDYALRQALPAPGVDAPMLIAARQKQRIEQWAAETGHKIIGWAEDIGVPQAGQAFEQAVTDCRGTLIVAVDAVRVSRRAAVLTELAEQVEAAGGQIGFVEGWDEPSRTLGALLELAVMADAAHAQPATYRRRPAGALDAANAQQQAAAVWDAADELGADVSAWPA